MSWYPSIEDTDFYNKIYSKQEFREDESKIEPFVMGDYSDKGIYQEPYQQFLRKFINKETPYNSILMYWAIGSGKTNGAISILENFNDLILKNNGLEKFLIITKNDTLQSVFIDEILKDPYSPYITERDRNRLSDPKVRKSVIKKIEDNYEFMNYQQFVNKVIGRTVNVKVTNESRREITKGKNIYGFHDRIIVVDEVQNITGNFQYLSLMRVLKNSRNVRLILLSATPVTDTVTEMIYISNLLNFNNPVFPMNEENMELDKKSDSQLRKRIQSFYDDDILTNYKGKISDRILPKFTDKGTDLLLRSLRGKISYVPINPITFPKKIRMGVSLTPVKGSLTVVKCKMSPYQELVYINSLSVKSQFEKIQSDLSTIVYESPNIEGATDINNLKITPLQKEFIGKYSTKIFSILNSLDEKNRGIAFIYSNNVTTGGTELIVKVLESNGYTHFDPKNITNDGKTFILFHSKLSSKDREIYKNVINDPNNMNGDFVSIIIGSPLIAEGISFLNVRQVHILEPYWNLATTLQAEGRCIRNYSHRFLPENKQNVRIYWYVSVFTNEYFDENGKLIKSIDDAKYTLCEEKDRINKEIERYMKEIAIDCYNTNKIVNIKKNKYKEIYENFFKDYSSDCDYQKCEYSCKYIDYSRIEKSRPRSVKEIINKNSIIPFVDDSTYSKNTDIRQILLIKSRLKNMFNYSNALNIDIILKQKEFENLTIDNIYYALSSLVSEEEIVTLKNKGVGKIVQSGKYYKFVPLKVYEIPEEQEKTLTDFWKKITIESNRNNNNNNDTGTGTNNSSRRGSDSSRRGSSSRLDSPSENDTIVIQDNIVKKIEQKNKVFETRFNPVIDKLNSIMDFVELNEADIIGIIEDDKFKLADVRINKNNKSGREQNRGRVCSSYSKDDIIKFGDLLNLGLTKGNSKMDLCKQIYKHLKEKKLIIKL